MNLMDRKQVIEQLREIIKPYAQDPEALANLSEESDFLKDLKINSAHLVDIILDAEDAFDIEIDDDSADQMFTVGAAIDIILKQKEA